MPERRLLIGWLGDTQRAAAPHSARRSRRHGDLSSSAIALAIITALGLLLRMHQIGAASLWYDEIFSAYWIHRPLSYLWTDGLIIETTPPLYYTLLKLWAVFAGDSDMALRLFSAAASSATIPLVFLLGAELATPAVGLIAALFFALAPMQIYYAQEARGYAMLPFAFALALLGLLRFLRAARQRGAQADPWAIWLYTAGAALLVYSHATSVFTVAALASCGTLLLLRAPRRRAALFTFIAANAAIALLSIPELRAIVAQTGRQDLAWIRPPDLIGLLNLGNHLLVDPLTPSRLFRLSSMLSVATLFLLATLVPLLRLRRVAAVLLLGVPIAFLATVIGLSYLSPFLLPRIVIWIGVPFCLLAGLALVSPAPRWLRGVFALAYGACILVGLYGVFARTVTEKEDWRGLMAHLIPRLGGEDVVAVGPDTSVLPLLRYARGTFADNGRQVFQWEPQSRPADLYVPDHILPPLAATTETLAQEAQRGRPVWVLLRANDWAAYAGSVLTASRPPTQVDRSRPGVVLLRW
jgi:mannosyltransferase